MHFFCCSYWQLVKLTHWLQVSLQRHFANGYKNIFQSLNFLKMVRKFGKSFQINLNNVDVFMKVSIFTLWLFADRGRRTALIDGNMWNYSPSLNTFIFLISHIHRYGDCGKLSSVCNQVFQDSSSQQSSQPRSHPSSQPFRPRSATPTAPATPSSPMASALLNELSYWRQIDCV